MVLVPTTWPRCRPDQYLSACILVLVGVLVPFTAPHPPAPLEPTLPLLQATTDIPVQRSVLAASGQPLQPVVAASESGVASLSAIALYVIDVPSGSILFEQNAYTARAPASTTKLMTALVAREYYTPKMVLEVGSAAGTPGATAGLFWSEQLTVEELLKAMLVQSANDAAMVFAQHYPGGHDGFVAAMNDKAKELDLENTHFTNVVGFDAPEHYTSARDLSVVAREVMRDEVLRDIVKLPEVVVQDVTGTWQHRLKNTNDLLELDPSVVGVKTGTTEQAGQVLVTQVEREGRTVQVVLLGSADRFVETERVLDWIFNTYTWVSIAEFRAQLGV